MLVHADLAPGVTVLEQEPLACDLLLQGLDYQGDLPPLLVLTSTLRTTLSSSHRSQPQSRLAHDKVTDLRAERVLM